MRRLFRLLILSSMISGLLLFGATSAFAVQGTEDLQKTINELTGGLGGEEDPTGGLLGLEELLCGLLGEEGLVPLLQCLEAEPVTPPVTPPPASPVTPIGDVGDVGHVGHGQVSHVPHGGISAGGGTAPVATTALIGTLLAMAAVGAGLGRALARS